MFKKVNKFEKIYLKFLELLTRNRRNQNLNFSFRTFLNTSQNISQSIVIKKIEITKKANSFKEHSKKKK